MYCYTLKHLCEIDRRKNLVFSSFSSSTISHLMFFLLFTHICNAFGCVVRLLSLLLLLPMCICWHFTDPNRFFFSSTSHRLRNTIFVVKIALTTPSYIVDSKPCNYCFYSVYRIHWHCFVQWLPCWLLLLLFLATIVVSNITMHIRSFFDTLIHLTFSMQFFDSFSFFILSNDNKIIEREAVFMWHCCFVILYLIITFCSSCLAVCDFLFLSPEFMHIAPFLHRNGFILFANFPGCLSKTHIHCMCVCEWVC